MCVFVCVGLSVCVYVLKYICVCICVFSSACVCVCVCVFVCVCLCLCVHIHIKIYKYYFIKLHNCNVNVYVCSCMHKYIDFIALCFILRSVCMTEQNGLRKTGYKTGYSQFWSNQFYMCGMVWTSCLNSINSDSNHHMLQSRIRLNDGNNS